MGTTASMVAPVVVGPANSQYGLAFLGSPVNMLMTKNAVPPKFTGRHSDGASFRRDGKLDVQMLGGRCGITDRILLSTMGRLQDDGTRMNLQRRKESSEITSYEQYWEELNPKFGDSQGMANRQAWEALWLRNEGRTTMKEFRCFWEKFLLHWGVVLEPTEEEARTLFMQ